MKWTVRATSAISGMVDIISLDVGRFESFMILFERAVLARL